MDKNLICDEKKPYGFIYMTTNLINGRKYIGQKKHGKGAQYYLGSGIALKSAIKKYGRENFERITLQECYSQEELDQAEIEWIAHFDATNKDEFYNIARGGNGSGDGNHFYERATEEQIANANKIRSQKMSGANNPFYGKKHSESSRKIISEKLRLNHSDYWVGKHLSEEAKRKIGAKSKERALAGNIPFKGCHHTEQTKRIISEKAIARMNAPGYVSPNGVKTRIKNKQTMEILEFSSRRSCFEYLKDNKLNLNNKNQPLTFRGMMFYFANYRTFCNGLYDVIK